MAWRQIVTLFTDIYAALGGDELMLIYCQLDPQNVNQNISIVFQFMKEIKFLSESFQFLP